MNTEEQKIHWVNVADRLPEPEEKVLVFVTKYGLGIQLGKYIKTQQRWYVDGTNSELHVSHWAKLNAP